MRRGRTLCARARDQPLVLDDPPLGLLEMLDHDMLLFILRTSDVSTRGRIACACWKLWALSLDPSVWATVELKPSAVRVDRALRRLGRHTREVHVRNALGAPRHKFCRWHLLGPNPHPFESACGGLLDAGSSALVRTCPNLEELHLPGMGHLTKATLVAVLRGCRSLRVLNLRGCERVCSGFAASAAEGALAARPLLRDVDLSHAGLLDADLVALLGLLPALGSLKLNFNAELSDAVLDALPPTVVRVEALGCERFSWRRMEQLREDLGTDKHGGPCLRCDDSEVLAVGTTVQGNCVKNLFTMLASYHAEERCFE